MERFRQRVMHEFSIYPRCFGTLLCTGCGRCARACPAGMNLPEVLSQLIQLGGAEPREQPMNLYQPYLMGIEAITEETSDIRTYKLQFKDSKLADDFQFNAGQFGEYWVFGEGESTFSSPRRQRARAISNAA